MLSLLLISPLWASPLPQSGPATACIPEALTPVEATPFTPPDPPVQVRVSTPLGRTLLLTDTDQDEGLSSFRWRRKDYCLGYGFEEEKYFVLVRGQQSDGIALLGARGTLYTEITPERWREDFGRAALYIRVEPLN